MRVAMLTTPPRSRMYRFNHSEVILAFFIINAFRKHHRGATQTETGFNSLPS